MLSEFVTQEASDKEDLTDEEDLTALNVKELKAKCGSEPSNLKLRDKTEFLMLRQM